MGSGKAVITSSKSAATVFLVLIGLYVLCIIGLQINWSNNNIITSSSNPTCDQGECTADSPPQDGSEDAATFDFTRRLFGLMRLPSAIRGNSNNNDVQMVVSQNYTTKNHTEFDPGECFLKHKLEKPGMPIIHSVFVDSLSQDVVITGVLRHFFDSWHAETFHCIFEVDAYEDVATNSDPIVQDFKRFGDEAQYSVVIVCPLPEQMLGRPHFKMSFRRVSNHSLSYDNITVCEAVAATSSKHFLTMCTMTKDMDRYIPNWLDYHKLLGVEHVYIYDNSVNSTLPKNARRYVDAGFLTIIPWAHKHTQNKTYLEVQVASENDCMWRYKHTSHWMIKVDVDEFLQPMDPLRTTIPEYLNDSQIDRLGSVRIQNWFFCRHPTLNYGLKSLHTIRSVFERNLVRNIKASPINRGRDKAIARPANVHYYKIHGVKLGGDTLSLSPTTEIRLVHYRGDNPRHVGFCSGKAVADFSMIRQWYRLHNANVTELDIHLENMHQLMQNLGKNNNVRKMHSYLETSSFETSTLLSNSTLLIL